MGSLVIRADAGAGVGAGHLARCLALVQAWVDAGGTALLCADDVPRAWRSRYEAEGATLAPRRERIAADWVVFDGYRFDARDRDELATGRRVLIVDDHGASAHGRADVLLDHNPGASPLLYRDRRPGTDLLLGSRFALLRRELRLAVTARTVRPQASVLLAALGGEPPPAAVELLRDAIGDGASVGLEVDWASGGEDVVAPMLRADLAVAGAGVTASELCALGVPALLVTLADNQVPVAAALAERGAAVSLGALLDLTSDQLAAAIAQLAGDSAVRRALVGAGQALVDGRGALRVTARMRADLIGLRPATADDAQRLWEWVNDDTVRANSFTREPVPWDDHVAWLNGKLRDPNGRLWIVADEAGATVGQARVDVEGSEGIISVGLGREHRGRRLASAVIDAATRRAFAETDVSEIVAWIRPDNVASLTSFEDAAFDAAGEGTPRGVPALRYARSR